MTPDTGSDLPAGGALVPAEARPLPPVVPPIQATLDRMRCSLVPLVAGCLRHHGVSAHLTSSFLCFQKLKAKQKQTVAEALVC
jgi:hypothetical protein